VHMGSALFCGTVDMDLRASLRFAEVAFNETCATKNRPKNAGRFIVLPKG